MEHRCKIGFCLLLMSVLCLPACMGSRQAMQPPAPVVYPDHNKASVAVQPVYHYGSICQLDGPAQSSALFYDSRRARNVGDIVFVLIAESFKGTGKASTQSDGSNSSSYAIPALLGHENVFDIFGADADMSKLIETKRTTKTKGDGATSRSNTLSARVAARVVEVLPNNNYRIRGSHYTKVNGEDHFVTLSGIIRASDISASNTISSVLIADSNIDYGGYGDLGSKQRIGWATRILDVVWPF